MNEKIPLKPGESGRWHLARLWHALIEPAAAIREPERHRRARLLSALLVVSLLIGIGAIILTLLGVNSPTGPVQAAFTGLLVVAMVVLTAAYGLSRTRHSEPAAILTIFVVLLTTFLSILIDPGIRLLFAFPIVGGMMSGLFLSQRATILVFTITLLAMLGLLVEVPNSPSADIVNAAFFIVTVGAIMVVGATISNQDMKQIEAQSLTLADKEANLQVAIQSAREANEELAERVGDLEQSAAEITLLSQMGEMLQTCQNAGEAYAVIGQFTQRLFPATSGAVYLINASRNYVEAAVTWGEASHLLNQHVFELNDCWGLRRGRMHLMQDHSSDLPCRHVEVSRRTEFSSVCIPMMAQGEALGMLHMGADVVMLHLTENRLRLAQAIAEQLSLALANLRLRETLRDQSIRDLLTGLFNRRYLEETFERELRRSARAQSTLGVIMLDIDHFKRFNDDHGHPAGDALLHELGTFLMAHIRGADIACRYGGEEFALILPDTSLETSLERAESLRQEIGTLRVLFRGQPLGPITVSLGVAAFPNHGSEKGILLHLADDALYRAKQGGRNRTVIASS